MASSWSDLKIQLMATGENTTTWGAITNANLGTAIEDAITGSVDVSFTGSNVTLAASNSTSAQDFRNLRLNLTGTGLGSLTGLTVPNIEKLYIVKNALSDNVEITSGTGANGTVTVPAGVSGVVFCTGSNAVTSAINYLPSLTLGTALAAAQGGTGINAAGTAGNVLTSNGSAWVSQAAGSAFTTGMIILWSGSIITIPVGWALCDGNNGTPDLQDRFVVGAGSTYAVGGTGGSPNAIVVSHTHTATSIVTDPGHDHTNTSRSNGSVVGGCAVGASDGSTIRTFQTASNTTGISVATTVATSGSSGTNANLPPYYALAYIMKL